MGRKPRSLEDNRNRIFNFFNAIRGFVVCQINTSKDVLHGKSEKLSLADINEVLPISELRMLLREAKTRFKTDLSIMLREEVYNTRLFLTIDHDFEKVPLMKMSNGVLYHRINEQNDILSEIRYKLEKNERIQLKIKKEIEPLTNDAPYVKQNRVTLTKQLRRLDDEKGALARKEAKAKRNLAVNAFNIPSASVLNANDAIENGFDCTIFLFLQHNPEFAAQCKMYYDSLCLCVQAYYENTFFRDEKIFDRIPVASKWYVRAKGESCFLLRRAYRIMADKGWIESGKEEAFVGIFAGVSTEVALNRPVAWTKKTKFKQSDINFLMV